MTLQLPEPTKDEVSKALRDIQTTSTMVRTVRVQNKHRKPKLIVDRFWARSKDTWCEEPDKLKAEYRNKVIERDGEKCNICKLSKVSTLSIDHKLPISRGGPVNGIENMQLLCSQCHDEKTRREYIENGLSRRLRKH